jgi:uncharacterized SAM-dependent methyltransferase
MGLDMVVFYNLLAALAGGRMAIEAFRVRLETGAMWLVDVGTPSASVTSDLIDALCIDDLTIADLKRYACVLTAGGRHDAALKAIQHRYAALVSPPAAAKWMEEVTDEVRARHRRLWDNQATVGSALYRVGRMEAEEIETLVQGLDAPDDRLPEDVNN